MEEVNSMTMQFNVNNQTLTKTSNEKVVEYSVNYLYAQFTFNSNWDNVDRKYLIVRKDDMTNKVLLDNENKGLIPSVFVTNGTMSLAVIGVDDNNYVVITTNPVYVPIYKTLIPYGEEPFLKFIDSNTLEVTQSGDRAEIELPNIYFKDSTLVNDVLSFFGRDSVLLKAINMPYGLLNDIQISLDQTTYILTLNGYDKNNNLLFSRSADFNIETKVFKRIYYDAQTQELVFVTMDDEKIEVPIGDILTGIATQDWVNLNFYNKIQIDNFLNQKQDKLVNQSNIKSINGTSILGSGNIDTQNVGVIELDFSEAVDDEITLTDEQIALMQKDYAVVKVEEDYFGKIFYNVDDNVILFYNVMYFQTMQNSGVRENVTNYIVVNTSEKTATYKNEIGFAFYEKNKVDELLALKQNVINALNKLNADYIEENSNKKFVTENEKNQITTNQNAISGIKDGQSIDSFGDVESALALKEDTSNKVTSLSSSSTDTQYPSAKVVYDSLDNITLSGDNTSIEINSKVISVKSSYIDSQFLTDVEMETLLEEVFN